MTDPAAVHLTWCMTTPAVGIPVGPCDCGAEPAAHIPDSAGAPDVDTLVETVNEARRSIAASLIAVKGHLDTPYPDDPRWTPWTRFVERELRRLDDIKEAVSDLAATARRVAELERSFHNECAKNDELSWKRDESDREATDAATRVAELEAALRPFAEKWDLHAADYLMEKVDGAEMRVLEAAVVAEMIKDVEAARAALAGTPASTDNHEAASPLYREERDRWLSECSCGWEQEGASAMEARVAWENHKSAMDELAGDEGGA